MLRFLSPDNKMLSPCLEQGMGGGDWGLTVNWWDFYCLRNTVPLSRIIKCFANRNSLEAINQQCLCCEMFVDSLLIVGAGWHTVPMSLAGLSGVQGRDAGLEWVVWLRALTLQAFLSQR